MTTIDPEYLVLAYLTTRKTSVDELTLYEDLSAIVADLFTQGISVQAGFHKNAMNRTYSEEIISTLRLLREAGLIKITGEYDTIFELVPNINGDRCSSVLTCHVGHTPPLINHALWKACSEHVTNANGLSERV